MDEMGNPTFGESTGNILVCPAVLPFYLICG